ncbi:MAG: hypothetical protein QW292_14400 [Candidatus Parvarchaeota archaeon]
MNRKPVGYLLFHKGGFSKPCSLGCDIFVLKRKFRKFKKYYNYDYIADYCDYARDFLKKNKKYVLLCSTDDCHITTPDGWGIDLNIFRKEGFVEIHV